jgi:hypothetical protein
MKTQIFMGLCLLGSAIAGDDGYVVGGTGSAFLPSSISSDFTVTTTTVNTDVTVPNFPSANTLSLRVGTITSASQTAKNLQNAINSAKRQTSTPVRSIESLFTRFPSKTELDKFADNGDTGAISKALQVVASDDSVPCGTKVSYLLELLGTIKAAITRKNLAADQLATIIDGAKAEIARLQGEIARVQRER